MKAGAKAAVDETQLPFCPRSTGAARFAAFCEQFVEVPKGTGALSPLRLRDWQRDLVGSVEDADVRPGARRAVGDDAAIRLVAQLDQARCLDLDVVEVTFCLADAAQVNEVWEQPRHST